MCFLSGDGRCLAFLFTNKTRRLSHILQRDCFLPTTAPCAAVVLLCVLPDRSKLNIKINFCFVCNRKILVCRIIKILFVLKAGRPHLHNYLTHRETPRTYNDFSLLFAALGKAEVKRLSHESGDRRTLPSALSPCFGKLGGR